MRTAGGIIAAAVLALSGAPAAAQVSMATGRTEAENMTKTNYETNSFEGVTCARATSTALGNVRGTFSGPSGTYDITVRYHDETDGQAMLTLRVGGAEVDSWILNADDHVWKTRTVNGVTIANGAEVRVDGARQTGEHARVDFIEIVGQAPPGGCQRTVNVASSASLQSAASGAQSGDCIVAANGSYAAFTVTADGTSSAPIVIRAANRGGATLNSGIVRLNGANWVTVEGFRITSPGGQTTLDGESRRAIVSLAGSNNCRIHDQASGTAEAIVLGGLGMTGDYQDLNTIVEHNLFVNCDGDPEVVSIKSSSNIVRYNTLRTSGGGLVSRAGNKSQIYGNFIFGGNKSGSHGVRIHEMDHTVYNNYIENTNDYAMNIASGHSYSDSSFSHARVVRARVVHNTVVNLNGRPAIMGWGNSGTRTLAPLDCVFANNTLRGSATLMAFPNPECGCLRLHVGLQVRLGGGVNPPPSHQGDVPPSAPERLVPGGALPIASSPRGGWSWRRPPRRGAGGRPRRPGRTCRRGGR